MGPHISGIPMEILKQTPPNRCSLLISFLEKDSLLTFRPPKKTEPDHRDATKY
jgi:hypothetical protein